VNNTRRQLPGAFEIQIWYFFLALAGSLRSLLIAWAGRRSVWSLQIEPKEIRNLLLLGGGGLLLGFLAGIILVALIL
jgi:hypothetical protein